MSWYAPCRAPPAAALCPSAAASQQRCPIQSTSSSWLNCGHGICGTLCASPPGRSGLSPPSRRPPLRQADALRDYVDKEEKQAITECVLRALKREQGDAFRSGGAALEREGDVASLIADQRQSVRRPAPHSHSCRHPPNNLASHPHLA